MKKHCSQCKTETTHKTTTIDQQIEKDGRNIKVRIIRYMCTKCGKFIEAVDTRIEELQDNLCERFGFKANSHRLEIFGLCKECNE